MTDTAIVKAKAGASSSRSGLETGGLVVAAGAVGGFAYWVLQRLAGLHPFEIKWYAAVPALVFVGAFAAVVGVFFLANSDTNELKHTLAFALICGLAWEPVLKAATNTAIGTFEAYKGEAAVSFSQSLQEELHKPASTEAQVQTRAQQVQKKAADTANQTATVVEGLATVKDEGVRRKLLRDSDLAVSTLGQASSVNPEASIKGLLTVGKAAAARNQNEVSSSVLTQLEQIRARNPQLAGQVEAARNEIEAAQPATMRRPR